MIAINCILDDINLILFLIICPALWIRDGWCIKILGQKIQNILLFLMVAASQKTFNLAKVHRQASAATLRPKNSNFVSDFLRGSLTLC